MAVTRLQARAVERVWGATRLPSWAEASGSGAPVGELWLESAGGDADDLLLKFLFTTQALSVQVHPDDGMAKAAGGSRGKDEAWLVMEAEPGATIGLGLRRRLSRAELRAAAEDGSIEALIDWRPVGAGDMIYVPAGTIHAIGPGLILLEVQQNADITFRLYDYGRPRALHLDEAVAAACLAPFPAIAPRNEGNEAKVEGSAFAMERRTGAFRGRLPATQALPVWLVPLTDGVELAGEPVPLGSAWRVDEAAELGLSEAASVIVAQPRLTT